MNSSLVVSLFLLREDTHVRRAESLLHPADGKQGSRERLA